MYYSVSVGLNTGMAAHLTRSDCEGF